MKSYRIFFRPFEISKAVGSLALILITAPTVWSQKPAAEYRVHCGGTAFVDVHGHAWQADAQFSGGEAAEIPSTILGTDIPQLYQTERWNNPNNPMTYSFKVLPGDYKVNLHFAEIWDQAFFSGARVFNVSINGTVVNSDLDVFAQVGADAALIIDKLTTAGSDSLITIGFENKAGNAKIAGIEVLPVNPPPGHKGPIPYPLRW